MDAHTHRPAATPHVYVLSPGELKSVTSSAAYFCAGIHPWHVAQSHWQDVLRWSAQPHCVAIGETGLDRLYPHWSEQLKFFEQHWDLAQELQKPLVVHVVRSVSDVMALLKRRKATTPWLWHDFTGPLEAIPRLLKLHPQLYFSCGIRSIRRPNFDTLWNQLPASQRLLETDDAGLSIAEVYQLARVRPADLRANYVALFPQVPW